MLKFLARHWALRKMWSKNSPGGRLPISSQWPKYSSYEFCDDGIKVQIYIVCICLMAVKEIHYFQV